jgi:flagellar assembly protein FliH
VQPYVYQTALGDGGADGRRRGGNGHDLVPDSNSDSPASQPPPPVGISEEEVRRREEQARAQGVREGDAQARTRFERELAAERATLAKTLRDFAREREVYFGRVEGEVVKLAVGIARKILHREAQVDPLLLAGVVRVALEKMSAGTSVRLRVHPDHVYAWHDFFANQKDHRSPPELLGDGTLDRSCCVLETALGSTELTLEAQLAEIERGFFDLLAQRPGAR